jgi:DNA-binding beta-propeller fold protein YncE
VPTRSSLLPTFLLVLFAQGPLDLSAQNPLPGAGPFQVVRRFRLGGEGGWDYLVAEPGSSRLFVTRSTHVIVVDRLTGSLLGDIPETPGVHGVALDPARHVGFTSNGRDSSVTMFDLATLAPLRRLPVGARNPDAILYDSASDRLITFNGGSANASVLDPATGKLLGLVQLDGKPEAGVGDGRGHVYVNIEDRSELTLFDARTRRVTSTWSLADCEEPTGLAIDRESRRLFVGCGNSTLLVVDGGSGRPVAHLPIGEGVDGVAFEPATHRIYATSGAGTLTVAREENPDSFFVEAVVPTQPGARTVSLDPARHEIYTISAEFEAPAATAPGEPRPRRRPVPDTFTLLVVAPVP